MNGRGVRMTVAQFETEIRSLANSVAYLRPMFGDVLLRPAEVEKVLGAMDSIRSAMLVFKATDEPLLEHDTDRPPAPELALCEQAGCTTEACFSFVWPMRGRSNICAVHFVKLELVAPSLGLSMDSLDVQIANPSPCGKHPRHLEGYCTVCSELRGDCRKPV